MEFQQGIFRVKVLAIYVSHGARHSESCGCWQLLNTAMLSGSFSLLVNLKQRFIKFNHKALNHKSLVISIVAKLSIKIPWSNWCGNYRHVLKHAIF